MARAAKLKPTEIHSRKALGLAAWCVNVPGTLSHTGKRRQLFFDTKREAETECERLKARQDNFGISLSSLSPVRIAQATKAFEMLDAHGLDLLQTVSAQIGLHKQRTASVTLAVAFGRFEASGKKRSEKYLGNVRRTRAKLSSLLGKLVCDITPTDLEPILDSLPASSRNAKMRELRSVFNFCAKRGLMQQKSNPIGKLDFVAMPRHMVQIFPVDTVQALLNDALENDLAFLPYRVLNFFAGIRPEGELSRLQWSDVRIAERKVVLPAAITKKKKERHISLSDNAIEWLTEYQARGGSTTGLVAPFSATTLRRKHRRNYRAAGITKWIQSGGRHSYCSYWLQKFKDPDLLTLQSGHDDADTLWKSYYQGGSESEADRYWNIRPPTPATNIVPMAKAS